MGRRSSQPMPDLYRLLGLLRDEWDLDPGTAETHQLEMKIKYGTMQTSEPNSHAILRRVSADPLNTLANVRRGASGSVSDRSHLGEWHPPQVTPPATTCATKRANILSEILDTERTYVDCLMSLVSIYMCPIDPSMAKLCGVEVSAETGGHPTSLLPAVGKSSSEVEHSLTMHQRDPSGGGSSSYELHTLPEAAMHPPADSYFSHQRAAHPMTHTSGVSETSHFHSHQHKISQDSLQDLDSTSGGSSQLPTPGGSVFGTTPNPSHGHHHPILSTSLATPFGGPSLMKSFKSTTNNQNEAEQLATKFRGVLSPVEMKTIFGNVDTILMFHRDHILPELEQTIRDDAKARVGKVFLRNAAFIRIYSVYVNNFDHAAQLLTDLEKSRKKFAKFLSLAKRHPHHNQINLLSYLLLPVQRVPRYKLLLDQLLQNTPASHPDHDDLVKALAEIQERADEINEKKREQERNVRIIQIANHIRGSNRIHLIQPHRRFIRRGVLYLESQVTPTRNVRKHPLGIKAHRIGMIFYFYLFNDIMLQCSKTESHGQHLMNVLKLDTKVHPATLMADRTTLRLVDRMGIYYFQGRTDELERWAYVINNRFVL
ncbi:Dbl homology domain-containing protein [Dimargaris cristalligena]|uniref:Dbl homology domain-containing protein n=1 Tax=Dimargaris cristalligena TaxID=215637 RepID=A0A4P9ZJB8_9FUNG|nr:Dbl homology domain-containing protein [Dimargaris cristalligena]|eukprot:RKP33155.1 Dbl homology domain-containing protein [Dimargaris cristalligena]